MLDLYQTGVKLGLHSDKTFGETTRSNCMLTHYPSLNKSLIIKQIIPIIALFFVLTLAYLLNLAQAPQTNAAQCTFESDPCHFILGDEVMVVDLGQTPVEIEEETPIVFHLPAEYQLTSASIAGVNMYMGRTPVVFEPGIDHRQMDGHRLQGVFFLGSCSEPNMRWQMTIVITHKNSGNAETRFVNFATRRQ